MAPYELIGVEPDASQEEIKAAYHRRARETHPDVNDGSHEAFKAVAEAYRILNDPVLRAEYDEFGTINKQRPVEVLLADILKEVLTSEQFPDVVLGIKETLADAINKAASAVASHARLRHRIEVQIKNFKKLNPVEEEGVEDFLVVGMEWHVAQLSAQLSILETKLNLFKEAEQRVAHLKFKPVNRSTTTISFHHFS